jgi:hypothetical protein
MDRDRPRDLCPGDNLNNTSAAHDYRRALVHSRTVEHVIGHNGLEYWLNQWSALSWQRRGWSDPHFYKPRESIKSRADLSWTTRLGLIEKLG